MTKLPVFKTVAFAYAFMIGNIGTVIGLIWIPMLAVTVLGFFAESTYLDCWLSYMANQNPAALAPGLIWMFVFVFVALLANAMMLVPVLQQALGTRKGSALAHFALGVPEWRMFGAFLSLVGILLGLTIAFSLVGGVVVAGFGAAGAALATPEGMLALNAGVLIVSIAVMFVVLRLAFFIPAVAVIEEKTDLTRGWMLAKGNVLRLFAAIVLCGLPVMIVYFGLQAVLFGPDAVLPQMSAAKPTVAQQLAQLQEARARLPLSHVLGFVIAPLTVALNAGLVAAAYRALVSPGARPSPVNA